MWSPSSPSTQKTSSAQMRIFPLFPLKQPVKNRLLMVPPESVLSLKQILCQKSQKKINYFAAHSNATCSLWCQKTNPQLAKKMSPKKCGKGESPHSLQWGFTMPWAFTVLHAFVILCTNSISTERVHNQIFRETSFVEKTE